MLCSTAKVILSQVLSIATFGSGTHTTVEVMAKLFIENVCIS